MKKMTDGEFKKQFQNIANHIPMGMLNELCLREHHPILIPSSFDSIVKEAKQEFPTYDKVHEFREKYYLYDYSMDSLYIKIVREWAWKWLGIDIFHPLEKKPMKPEIKKWFDEK